MDASLVLTITIIFAVLILIVVFVAFYFVIRYFRLKELEIKTLQQRSSQDIVQSDTSQAVQQTGRIPQELIDKLKNENAPQDNLVGYTCVDHPELQAVGRCAISDELYCELCLTKERDVKIARKYLSLWLDNEWDTIFLLNNEKVGADTLNQLIKHKKQIWAINEVPIVTQMQFKINIEEDRSEAYTVVMAKTSDKDFVKSELSFIKE